MKLFFLVFHTLLHKHVNLFELVPRLPCMHQVREDVRARFLCKSMKLGSQAGLVVQVHLARRLRLLYPLAGERVLKSSQTKSAHASQHKHPTGKPNTPHHLGFSPINAKQEESLLSLSRETGTPCCAARSGAHAPPPWLRCPAACPWPGSDCSLPCCPCSGWRCLPSRP